MRPAHRAEVILPAVQFMDSVDNISVSSMPQKYSGRSLLLESEELQISSEKRRPVVALIPRRHVYPMLGSAEQSSDSEDEGRRTWDVNEEEFPANYVTPPVERAVTSIQAKLERNQWSQFVSFPRYKGASEEDEPDEAVGMSALDLLAMANAFASFQSQHSLQTTSTKASKFQHLLQEPLKSGTENQRLSEQSEQPRRKRRPRSAIETVRHSQRHVVGMTKQIVRPTSGSALQHVHQAKTVTSSPSMDQGDSSAQRPARPKSAQVMRPRKRQFNNEFAQFSIAAKAKLFSRTAAGVGSSAVRPSSASPGLKSQVSGVGGTPQSRRKTKPALGHSTSAPTFDASIADLRAIADLASLFDHVTRSLGGTGSRTSQTPAPAPQEKNQMAVLTSNNDRTDLQPTKPKVVLSSEPEQPGQPEILCPESEQAREATVHLRDCIDKLQDKDSPSTALEGRSKLAIQLNGLTIEDDLLAVAAQFNSNNSNNSNNNPNPAGRLRLKSTDSLCCILLLFDMDFQLIGTVACTEQSSSMTMEGISVCAPGKEACVHIDLGKLPEHVFAIVPTVVSQEGWHLQLHTLVNLQICDVQLQLNGTGFTSARNDPSMIWESIPRNYDLFPAFFDELRRLHSRSFVIKEYHQAYIGCVLFRRQSGMWAFRELGVFCSGSSPSQVATATCELLNACGILPYHAIHIEHCMGCSEHKQTTWHVPWSYETRTLQLARHARDRVETMAVRCNTMTPAPRHGSFEVYVLPYHCKRAHLVYSKIYSQTFPKSRELADALFTMAGLHNTAANNSSEPLASRRSSDSGRENGNVTNRSLQKFTVELFDDYYGEAVANAVVRLHKLKARPTSDLAETSVLPELPEETQQSTEANSNNQSAQLLSLMQPTHQPLASAGTTTLAQTTASVRPPPARRPQSASAVGSSKSRSTPVNPYELVLLADALPIPISIWSSHDMRKALQELGCSVEAAQELERRGMLNAASFLGLDDTTLQKVGVRLLHVRKAILRFMERVRPLARITQSKPSTRGASHSEDDVLEHQLIGQTMTDLSGRASFVISQAGAYVVTLSSAMSQDWSSQIFCANLLSLPSQSEQGLKCRLWPTIQKLVVYVKLEKLTEGDFKHDDFLAPASAQLLDAYKRPIFALLNKRSRRLHMHRISCATNLLELDPGMATEPVLVAEILLPFGDYMISRQLPTLQIDGRRQSSLTISLRQLYFMHAHFVVRCIRIVQRRWRRETTRKRISLVVATARFQYFLQMFPRLERRVSLFERMSRVIAQLTEGSSYRDALYVATDTLQRHLAAKHLRNRIHRIAITSHNFHRQQRVFRAFLLKTARRKDFECTRRVQALKPILRPFFLMIRDRRRYLRSRAAVVAIQRAVRRWLDGRHVRQHCAAVRISALLMCWPHRRRYLEQRAAVQVLQGLWRGVPVRRHYQRQREAAMCLHRVARKMIFKNRTKEKAAIVIQRWLRSKLVSPGHSNAAPASIHIPALELSGVMNGWTQHSHSAPNSSHRSVLRVPMSAPPPTARTTSDRSTHSTTSALTVPLSASQFHFHFAASVDVAPSELSSARGRSSEAGGVVALNETDAADDDHDGDDSDNDDDDTVNADTIGAASAASTIQNWWRYQHQAQLGRDKCDKAEETIVGTPRPGDEPDDSRQNGILPIQAPAPTEAEFEASAPHESSNTARSIDFDEVSKSPRVVQQQQARHVLLMKHLDDSEDESEEEDNDDD